MISPDMSALLREAETATAKAEWDRAGRAWHEICRHAPDHPGCFGKAAVAFRRNGDFAAADAVMQEAIATLGPKPAFLVALGDTAMDARDWRKALTHWAELRRIDPKRPKGYSRAAQAHLALKQPRLAEAICAQGLERLPRNKDIALQHAEAALRLGNRDAALARLDRAIGQHPKDAVLAQRRARIAAQSGATGSGTPAARSRSLLSRVKARLRPLLRRRRATASHAAPNATAKGKPSARALSRQLTELQQQRSPAKLQERIDAARAAWQTGRPLPDHAGMMRHFESAKTDARLADLLAGKTRRNPPRAPGDPIRVVFFFPRVTQTDNLMPLFERMHGDPRFAPMILCCRTQDRGQTDAYGFYAEKYPTSEGYRVIDGGPHVNDNLSFYELDADVVFFHTPYSLNAQRPFYLRADFAARHCRVANVTYGYPLLSLDTSSYHVYAGGHVKKCDMIFAESPACVEPYGRHLGPEKIHVTGYTKVDEFRRHLDPEPFESFAPKAERLDVMWTPHWQLPGDPKGDTETSNFLKYHEIMLKVAARPDVVLHVRPHPLLRQRLSVLRIMTTRQYDAILQRFRKAGAEVYPAEEGVSYVPALMRSAVLISDFSSLVAEFTITNRPIIFCRTQEVWSNGKWIGDFGKDLIENCSYVVDDAAGLEASLETILTTRRHPKAAQMARFVSDHALFPEGSATDRICDVIEQRLRAG